MSGTSLDGVDVVLVDLESTVATLIASHYTPFPSALKAELLALHVPSENELHRSNVAANQLARLYAESVTQLLLSTRIVASQISAIGCHGQTIRHCPEHGYTLQIGNAALLAELTGITVVSDFRSRDIAAGGQGAPLVPAFHDRVLRNPNTHRVILNIGGISNITNLSPHTATSGFDCGPGNLLMDEWCNRHLGKSYDENGEWAASGVVLMNLLHNLLAEPFFAVVPPKSTGRDLFNIRWLSRMLQGDERAEDVQATLLELTAISITRSLEHYCAGVQEVYLCGGGAHNKTLRLRLIELLPSVSVQVTDVLGVSGDFLEAWAFAWLAQQTLLGQPANLPIVTGARHLCILGAIHPA
jgi:anhydro-N-acetylmuramic acid kinase